MLVMLTNAIEWDYSDLALAKSSAGIEAPNDSGAMRRANRLASFFMADCMGSLTAGRSLSSVASTRTVRHPKIEAFEWRLEETKTQEAPMPNLSILEKEIRAVDGLYNLNDLHKASGNNPKQKPANWLRNQQAVDLIKLLKSEQLIPIVSKQGLGTYVCKELVYAYAMWISPKFHLAVIRAFDHQKSQSPLPDRLIEQRFLTVINQGKIIQMKPLGADVFVCDTSKVSEVVDLVRWFAPKESLAEILEIVSKKVVVMMEGK